MSNAERFVINVPRYSLAIVFLIFGVDKFVGYDRYVAWFIATERAQVIIPSQDIGQFVYVLGIAELILAGLLLSGFVKRASTIATSAALVTILVVAQYPSSFPQDLGLLGISIALTLSSKGKALTIEQLNKLKKIIRSALCVVLVLWSIDQIANTSAHVSWLQLFSPMVKSLTVDQISTFIISIAVIELVIAALVALGRLPKYSYIAAATFFALAMTLEPPLNGFQSIGLAIVSSWLAYLALAKKRS